MEVTESLLGVLAEEASEERLALRCQCDFRRKFKFFRKDCFIYFVGVSAVEGRKADQQFIKECSHAIKIYWVGMAHSE